ncbi:MAG: hypothetical protein R3356_01525, partial [Eudoraea sp.]|nr:hypothetical protein [Eudoraea sp.]
MRAFELDLTVNDQAVVDCLPGIASYVGADISVDDVPLSDAFQSLAIDDARQLAVSGGDDFELCFTAPAENEKEI